VLQMGKRQDLERGFVAFKHKRAMSRLLYTAGVFYFLGGVRHESEYFYNC